MGHPMSLLRLSAASLVIAVLIAGGCGNPRPRVAGEHSRFAGPTRMAMMQNFLDPYGPYLFIANSQGGDIAVVDAQKYVVFSANSNDPNDLDVIRVGRAPYDVALTPEGTKLFVTDAWFDNLRVITGWAGRIPDVFNAYVTIVNGHAFLNYDIDIIELPLKVRAGQLAIQPAPNGGRPVPVYVTDPDNQRIVVLDSGSGNETDEIILPEEPANIAISRYGDHLYVDTPAGNLLFIDAVNRTLLADQTIALGGVPGRIAVSKNGNELYVLNSDPPLIQVVRLSRPPRLYDTNIAFPIPPNGLAPVNDGRYVWVSADDGNVYVFDSDTRRICDSFAGRIFFTDKWPQSNPTMEQVTVKDCIVRSEQWEIIYRIETDDWTVRGTKSGLQKERAKSNQFFLTDDESVGFLIRENDLHSSDLDTFYFETEVGIAPLRVGLVPDAVSVIPYYLEPTQDILFIANSGSANLTILFTEDFKRIGVIN